MLQSPGTNETINDNKSRSASCSSLEVVNQSYKAVVEGLRELVSIFNTLDLSNSAETAVQPVIEHRFASESSQGWI